MSDPQLGQEGQEFEQESNWVADAEMDVEAVKGLMGRRKLTDRRGQGSPDDVSDQPVHLGALTADDWDAARIALGSGSKSLLFGTSTKILDSITQRFKEQAPAAVTPSEPDPKAGGPKGVGVTLFHHEQIEPKGFFMQDDSPEYDRRHMVVYISDMDPSKVGIAENMEGLRRGLIEAARRIEETTEQSDGPKPPRS